ncbi:GCN5 family acetyltransferase [Acidovorax sp. Root267]|jgi:GNAT superfamily N-acetyltransferase|uniref:GNAT family N-acetyltransferase n=1 Tax=Acidovorax sp. Root267 TaxID=1736505 RepID=UPI00070D6DBB|nr:GNAT family N-acetyltransferase [Acidovorax sp. Root267]KRD21890.1 GCN5 family acetyltransferase [Acidovorax sp. Root267]
MHTEIARPSDAAAIAAVLHEAAQWLVDRQMPLWAVSDFSEERVQQDVDTGHFLVARVGDDVAGVVRWQREDPTFWPDAEPGTSAFLHKLAVRRAWAGQGVSAALLAFGREHARSLGVRYLRLDCVADRQPLRALYEGFGFTLYDCVLKGRREFARYQIAL